MLRLFQSQRNRALVAMSGRIQASRGTVLFSTNATEVFDDEANRQQLEQVSQQMEDAMQKEKQVSTQMHQASSNTTHTWDASTQTVNEPHDRRIMQSNSAEMDGIQHEVRDQNRRHIGDDLDKQAKTNPMGFQTDGPTRSGDKNWNNNNSNSDNKNKNSNMTIDPSKVMDQVKDMAAGAAGLAAGAVNMAAGVGKVVQETAKATMNNVKEFIPSMPSTDDSSRQRDMPPGRNYGDNKSESSFMQETAKVTFDSAKDMVDGVMKPSVDSPGKQDEQLKRQQEQREWQNRNPGATQAGQKSQESSRGKEFSENRQNASLI
jgi:hypothetical protein